MELFHELSVTFTTFQFVILHLFEMCIRTMIKLEKKSFWAKKKFFVGKVSSPPILRAEIPKIAMAHPNSVPVI